MDAATAARMSDPDQNPHFRRRWQDLPAQREPIPIMKADHGLTALAQALQQAWLQRRRRDGEDTP